MSQTSDFYDELLQRDTDIDRVSAGYESESDDRNAELLLVVLGILAALDPLGVTRVSARKARIARIAEKIRASVSSAYRGRFGLDAEALRRIGGAERRWVERTLREVAGAGRKTGAIVPLRDTVIDGVLVGEMWRRAETYVAAHASQIIRRFYRGGTVQDPDAAAPLTSAPVVEEIERFFAGPVKRIAHTAVQTTVTAQTRNVRNAAYEANADVVELVRWTAIRDKSTCSRCAAMDGRKWQSGTLAAVGHDMPFVSPPLHARCRCSLTPIFADEDPDLPETFQQWLEDQPASVRKSVLGAKRQELFESGRVTELSELIDQSGRQISLEELERKS